MILDPKTLRREPLEIAGAAVDLEDLVAGAAHEVMVVMFAGPLVSGRLAGKLDRDQVTFLNELFDGTVDRRDPDAGHVPLGVLENLFRGERPLDAVEHGDHRLALPGVADCARERLRSHSTFHLCRAALRPAKHGIAANPSIDP